MAFVHHQTIRKYVAALIDFFNGIEIQYADSTGTTQSRNIPIVYAVREKRTLLDGKTAEALRDGNYDVLPRASLSLVTMERSEQRIKNKNVKIATVSKADTFDYINQSMPYEFTFELTYQCRGMNEATMIIEQIAPKFNPVINIDIWDASDLSVPTRIPVRLLDIGIETQDYDDLSSNIITLDFGLSVIGNIYPPVQSIPRIKEFKMFLNDFDSSEKYFSRASILGWDINTGGDLVQPGTDYEVQNTTEYLPSIQSITPSSPVVIGTNTLTAIWNDDVVKFSEMTFDWVLLQGSATLTSNYDVATLDITTSGTYEVQLTITDPWGNYASATATYTV